MMSPITHPTILVMNESTVLSDAQVQAIVPILQKQVTQDFYPVWGVNAELVFHEQNQSVSGSEWMLAVLDDSDQGNALGYHDLTGNGFPMGKVFAGSALKLGSSWTVDTSHELLEMLADPNIDLAVFLQNGQTTGLYAYEVCDPCQSDAFGYLLDNVLVSDFVFPAWFEWFHQPNSVQFDFQNKITRPFGVLPGGYISFFDIMGGSGWQPLQAADEPPNVFARGTVGSRRERRSLSRNRWVASQPFQQIRNNANQIASRLEKGAQPPTSL